MVRCEVCGKEIEKSQYFGNVLCSGECFTINFWRRIIAEKDKHIVINGVCYCDVGNVDNPLMNQTLDEFRDELPDTAEFYTPEHIHFANNLENSF